MAFISNGTTILDNGAFSVGLGGLVLLSEQTASGSASISFTSGIDSTYPIYCFEFINIHPSANGEFFQFDGSTNGGSTYAVTKTTTFFNAEHSESGTNGAVAYQTSRDLAQSTAFQNISRQMGADSDHSCSGYLYLFNPSSTTYVKHFISRCNNARDLTPDYTNDSFMAGYFNTTVAIDGVQFSMSSGNIDSGTIKLYGIKDS